MVATCNDFNETVRRLTAFRGKYPGFDIDFPFKGDFAGLETEAEKWGENKLDPEEVDIHPVN